MAAAASTVRASSPSATNRRRTLSTKVIGTTWSTARDNVHDVPLWTSAPDATATASSSSTRKGTPSARAARAISSGDASSVPRQDSSISATSTSPRRRSSIRSDAAPGMQRPGQVEAR